MAGRDMPTLHPGGETEDRKPVVVGGAAAAAAGASTSGAAAGSSAAAAAAAAAAGSAAGSAAAGSSADGDELAKTSVDKVKHPSGIVPSIENIVSTAFLGTRLDLLQIAMRARNMEYNPRRFAAVILRNKDPRSTALVFASGKMVIMGSKSEQDAEQASKKFEKMIKKTGAASVAMRDFKIHNVVGCADVKFLINLEDLNMEHGKFSKYEPEMFPGLTYKMQVPDVVLLIFSSGKVVLTKAKHRDDVYTAFEKIYPLLEQHRRK